MIIPIPPLGYLRLPPFLAKALFFFVFPDFLFDVINGLELLGIGIVESDHRSDDRHPKNSLDKLPGLTQSLLCPDLKIQWFLELKASRQSPSPSQLSLLKSPWKAR